MFGLRWILLAAVWAWGPTQDPAAHQAGRPRSGQDERAPVPDGLDLKRSEALIRDLFKDDYGRKDAEAQRALSARFLKQAGETRDDLPALFVLLREARDLAALGGDIPLAFKAADESARYFALDALELKRSTLTSLGKTVRTVGEFKGLALAHLSLGEAALAEEDLETAEGAFENAGSWGRKAKEVALVTRSESLLKEARGLRAHRASVLSAEKVLASNPEDPAANAVVGLHRCLKGDWSEGMKFLARGPEGPLREAATKDLTQPVDPTVCLALGDIWWSASERETGKTRQQLRSRASYWYSIALPGLAGLSKVKAEKRLSESIPWEPKVGKGSTRIPREGLIAEWLFEEGSGTRVASTSGVGNDGALLGGVEWTDGRVGKALRFGGSGYVSCKVPGLPAANAMQTISWWHHYVNYPTGAQSIITISDSEPSSAVQPGFKGGRVAVWKYGGVVLVSGAPPKAGEWHHYSYVYDGKRHLLYIDGALAATTELAPQTRTPTKCEFGRWWGGGGDSYFTGSLDQVRIYNRALSGAEVLMLAGE